MPSCSCPNSAQNALSLNNDLRYSVLYFLVTSANLPPIRVACQYININCLGLNIHSLRMTKSKPPGACSGCHSWHLWKRMSMEERKTRRWWDTESFVRWSLLWYPLKNTLPCTSISTYVWPIHSNLARMYITFFLKSLKGGFYLSIFILNTI